MQQLPFRHQQPVLLEAPLQGGPELRARAGLGQEHEDLAVVDRRDGCFEGGLAAQDDAHRIRALGMHAAEKLGAVHVRHAHVRHHHGEGRCAPDDLEPFGPAGSGLDVESLAELPAHGVEHVALVIDEQHSRAWRGGGHPACARPASMAPPE